MSAQALKYKEKGNAEFKKGNHAKAIEFYTYATELDPKNHIFFTNRATAYFKMGRYDRSLRDADKSIKLNDKWWKGYLKKCESLIKLERHQEAMETAQLGAQIFPEQAMFPTLVKRARASMFSGMSEAEVHKINGNEAFKSGKIEEAIEHYTQAIGALDTQTPEGREIAAAVYGNRAACNRQLYMHDEVVKDCTKALSFKPGHVKAFIRRAQSYESLEKYEEALADYSVASTMGGGSVATSGAARVRNGLRQLKAQKAKDASKKAGRR